MFTGLVTALGTVTARQEVGEGLDLVVDLADLAPPIGIGDSIALSGVCCTVVELQPGEAGLQARFHLTSETLDRTWLGQAEPGCCLNLEAALRAGQPLGGHLVQGHVDGKGLVLVGIDPVAGGELQVQVPEELARYCVMKGSITVDGVSLTIAGLQGCDVTIAVIPHTGQVTTLGRKAPGELVHIEVDVIAKYVEQMLRQRDLA
jgi:riboflavin synthase